MASHEFPFRRQSGEGMLRRTFVKGLAVGGAAVGLGLWRTSAFAQGNTASRWSDLSGTDFDLRIGETPMNFTGSPRTAITVNGSIPAPTLHWKEGDTVTLRVTNTLAEDASIHWHGILLPANMDGVPGLSFHRIRPGETYIYRFNVRQGGTYWYHSHSGFQEQRGVYGPLVIHPREPEPFRYDREHVVMLSDWTDESPERVLAKLNKRSDYYNFRQRTVGDFFRDVGKGGLKSALADRKMWGEMRMNPTDLADVSGYTYTYLVNGVTPAGNWTGLFKQGERVRLRFINGSAMSYFDVRIPGLKMTVVAADGQYVHPVTVDEFRIATAETYDVIVEPKGHEAFTIFAPSMDRTGFAAATLAVSEGLRAELPALDPRAQLTMADMGHGGMGHDMSAMSAEKGAGTATSPAEAPHAVHDTSPTPTGADPHAGHQMPAQPAGEDRRLRQSRWRRSWRRALRDRSAAVVLMFVTLEDTMMKRLSTLVLAFAVLTLSVGAQLVVHEGHEHKVMGTVTMAAADHVMLKDKDGKDVTVKVTSDTKVKAKSALKVQEIKPGTRVVVSAVEEKDKSMTAKTIEVGAAPAAAK